MSNFNQRGPMDEGPMTGRRMGRCTNYSANQGKRAATTASEQNENQGNDLPENAFGFGWKRGRGIGGRGRGLGLQNRFGRGF